MFSFPSYCSDGNYSMIDNLTISEVLKDYIKITEDELLNERDSVIDLL
jgi:hypothetical protein